MLAKLASAQGKANYAQRSRTIEPVFRQVKTVQDGGRFMRRGLRAQRPTRPNESSTSPPRPVPWPSRQQPATPLRNRLLTI
jgi:hypothetical protein